MAEILSGVAADLTSNAARVGLDDVGKSALADATRDAVEGGGADSVELLARGASPASKVATSFEPAASSVHALSDSGVGSTPIFDALSKEHPGVFTTDAPVTTASDEADAAVATGVSTPVARDGLPNSVSNLASDVKVKASGPRHAAKSSGTSKPTGTSKPDTTKKSADPAPTNKFPSLKGFTSRHPLATTAIVASSTGLAGLDLGAYLGSRGTDSADATSGPAPAGATGAADPTTAGAADPSTAGVATDPTSGPTAADPTSDPNAQNPTGGPTAADPTSGTDGTQQALIQAFSQSSLDANEQSEMVAAANQLGLSASDLIQFLEQTDSMSAQDQIQAFLQTFAPQDAAGATDTAGTAADATDPTSPAVTGQ